MNFKIKLVKYVNDEYQEKGIGSQAIDLVVQFYLAQEFKIQSFYAQIAKDNAASIKIFEKNGFLTDGVLGIGMFGYVRRV